jgi:hypothetical protein
MKTDWISFHSELWFGMEFNLKQKQKQNIYATTPTLWAIQNHAM